MREPTIIARQDFGRLPILLVDDNEDDAYLFRRAWKMAEIPNPLVILSDAALAVAYLKGVGDYSDRSRHAFPLAIFLDLNMPRMNGFEVLEWIRSQPHLKTLTVEVLTSSMRPQDVQAALQRGANAYYAKPGPLPGLVDLLRAWYANACHKSFCAISEPRP